jgi:hypothetical protein
MESGLEQTTLACDNLTFGRTRAVRPKYLGAAGKLCINAPTERGDYSVMS